MSDTLLLVADETTDALLLNDLVRDVPLSKVGVELSLD